MARGNKGFAEMLVGSEGARPAAGRLPPRTGILGARENRLAELAAGSTVSRVQELVDPGRCRIWDGHNRDYTALNETNCADLIESFRAQGKQEVPAVVRRVLDNPQFDFEVICGARRHWTVSWLRAHTYPDFRFLIEPRELTDEEAFRLADLENRSRKDLSDYERAMDYARAIERYYDGSQQRMVERLEVSKSWLSRYLELAKLPQEVVASYGTPHVIGISHAAVLAPLLRVSAKRERVKEAATALAAEQTALSAKGQAFIVPAVVTRRLTAAAATRATRTSQRELVIKDGQGLVLARGQKARGGAIAISIPASAPERRPEIGNAVLEILNQFIGDPSS